MTDHAETAAILRQFNEWRRCDEDIPQPKPREIGEAIDAAIEMIDRLEAAESDALEQARLNGMGASREASLLTKLEAAEKERDTLRAKIEETERQEPVGWLLDGDFYEVRQMSLYKDNEPLPGQTALYALPGAQAQPAPSVPDSWPVYADPFAYVIQHLNSNPYPLTKGETITFIKELRALYNAGPEAKP